MKTILFLLLFSLSACHLHGQMQGTLGIGISRADIKQSDQIRNADPLAFPFINLSGEYAFGGESRHLASVGFRYFRRGYEQTFDNNTFNFRFSYGGIPILYGYRFTDRLTAYSGMQFEAVIDVRVRTNGKSENKEFVYKNSTDLSFVLDYRIDDLFSVSLGYLHALTPTLKEYPKIGEDGLIDGTISDLYWREFSIQFTVRP